MLNTITTLQKPTIHIPHPESITSEFSSTVRATPKIQQAPTKAPQNEDPAQTLFYKLIKGKTEQAAYLTKGQAARELYCMRTLKWDNAPSEFVFALVNYYTDKGFEINKELNKSNPDKNYLEFKIIVNQFIDGVDVPYKYIVSSASLFHGAEPDDFDANTLEVGKTIKLKKFFSTSRFEDTALKFADCNSAWCGKGYMYVIDKAKGALLNFGISEYNEDEVLLKAGSEFKITRIEWKSDVYYTSLEHRQKKFEKIAYVHVEQIN